MNRENRLLKRQRDAGRGPWEMDFCGFLSLLKASALVSGLEYSSGTARSRRQPTRRWRRRLAGVLERPTAEAYAPLDENSLFGMLPASRERN